MCEYCKNHQIRVSDDVYRYLKDMIEGEHIENGDYLGESWSICSIKQNDTESQP